MRFAPDGTVTEIAERPTALSPQQWFGRLTEKFGGQFSAMTGGRGLFRLEPGQLDGLKAAMLQ